MPAARIGQQKGPLLLHDNAGQHIAQPMLQKLNELGYSVLPLPLYSPDLLPTDFKQLANFLQGKCFHNQPAGGRKCFQRIRQIPKYGILHYRNKQTYFSLAKIH